MHKPRRRPPAPSRTAMLRRGSIRIPMDVATRVRAGHPWVFRNALGDRQLVEPAGAIVDVADSQGNFVGRALYDPDGAIALRVFSRRRDESPDAAYLLARVEAARDRREALLDLSAVSALRVFAGESEGLPGVTVECYADFLVAHFFSAAALRFREPLYDALAARWQPQGIYEQQRLRPLSGEGPRAPATLARGARAPIELEVREEDARFLVDVTAPQNVGLFPDLREGRRAVRRLARGKRVLNLFSYTGAFTVAAALGGATQVTAVDVSAKGHARARQNLLRSGLDPEQDKEYFAEDVFKMLARLRGRGRWFDLAIVDPPTFSQSKGRVFTALKDWAELGEEVLGVLSPGGLLLACSNTVKLEAADLERALGEAAARAGVRLGVVGRVGLPPDFPVAAGFPEGHYLKCVLAVRE